MPRKPNFIDFDNVRRLRGEGKSIAVIAKIIGIKATTLWSGIYRTGFDIGERIKGGPERIDLDANEIVQSHLSGETVQRIAKRIGVSRGTIVSRLIDQGITPRSFNQAQSIRFKNSTQEYRSAITRSAHDACRNREASIQEKIKRANTRHEHGTHKGFGEIELFEAMSIAGLEPKAQWPCGFYNIDIGIDLSIAVELLNLPTAYLRSPKCIERSKYLRNQGYCIVLVMFHREEQLIANLDYIVTFLKRAELDPALRSKDWMIRCSSQRFARGSNDLGQLTAVPTPERFIYSISEWNP